MPGKGFKPAGPEVKEQAREMRRAGRTIESIAIDLGVSSGSVSGWCRGIPVEALSRKRAIKKPVESSAIIADSSRVLDRVPESERVMELANQVKETELAARKAEADARVRRLQAAEEDDAQRREYNEDLRRRVKEAETREAEARARAYSSGTPEVMAQVETARAESQRLREQLTEQRHQEQMSELRRGFESQMSALASMLKDKSGITPYDIIGKGLDKAENLAIMVTDKVDKMVKGNQGDKQLMMALSLGLSPPEYALLQQGEDPLPTREDWELGRRYRAHQDGVKLEEPEPGEYEGLVALIEGKNRRWQGVMGKVSQRLDAARGGSRRVEAAGHTAPATAEVLAAGSKIVDVKCSHCGKLVSVDLLDLKIKSSAYGKCPECQATLDLSAITGVKPSPDCFVGDGNKCQVAEETALCAQCAWA